MRNASPIPHERARDLLGQNFFGVQDWSTFCGATLSPDQARRVAAFPWGEEVLNAPCPFVEGRLVRETHFAFLGLGAIDGAPLTVLRLHDLHARAGRPLFYHAANPWYEKFAFASETTCDFRWRLALQEIVPGSAGKAFEDQMAALPPGYEVPSAVEEALKATLHFVKNGVCLNARKWGRCRDTLPDGSRVSVGRFGPRGLFINHYWGDGSGLGLAASRKHPVQLPDTVT
ncbi:hypothetical protein HYY27_09080 [bacterium]|nr:hypothetical protein [bacterium]